MPLRNVYYVIKLRKTSCTKEYLWQNRETIRRLVQK